MAGPNRAMAARGHHWGERMSRTRSTALPAGTESKTKRPLSLLAVPPPTALRPAMSSRLLRPGQCR